MKIKNILLSIILASGAVINIQGIAKADYVHDVIRDTNNMAVEGQSLYDNVLAPAMQQRYYYLQSLANLCLQGNTLACNEYNTEMRAEHQRLSNAVEQMQNRENPYLN